MLKVVRRSRSGAVFASLSLESRFVGKSVGAENPLGRVKPRTLTNRATEKLSAISLRHPPGVRSCRAKKPVKLGAGTALLCPLQADSLVAAGGGCPSRRSWPVEDARYVTAIHLDGSSIT